MAGELDIALHRLPHHGELPLPAYASAGAAGLDLYAALPAGQPVTLDPGARALIPTGFALALPDGFEAQLRPRSGLALKYGITVLNSPGTIDADYRGELGVILWNGGSGPFTVSRGERIAQLVVAPVTRVRLREVAQLPPSERAEAGFGSTGTAPLT